MSRSTWILGLTVALISGCSEAPHRPIDTNEFGGSVANALFFDLNESPATTTVLLLQTRAPQTQLRVLALPFASGAVTPDRQLLLSSGTHGRATILTIVAGSALPESSIVRIRPIFERADESEFFSDDLQGSAYFLSSGLKRRFFYRGPLASEMTSEPWRSLSSITNISLSHVVVRMPVRSEVFERPPSALAPEFGKDSLNGKIRGYSYPTLSAVPIDLRYQIPPTKRQEQIFEYGIKLFIALFAPLVALGVLTSDKVRSAKARQIVIGVGVLIEVLVLAGLFWWAFYIQSVAGLGAILDIALALIAVASMIVLTKIKKPTAD